MSSRTVIKVRSLPADYWQVVYRDHGRLYTASFSRAECPDAASAARLALAGIRPGVLFHA